jgi:hypothetical protein
MLRFIIMLAAVLLALPVFADGIVRQGADWVRITALPCKHEAVVRLLTKDGEDPKDYRAASAEFGGRAFAACAKPIWSSETILLRYEDGDGGFIPFDEIKPAPEA